MHAKPENTQPGSGSGSGPSGIDLLRAVLEARGELFLRVMGSSMYPALKDGDVVRLVPATQEELHRGDVAAVVPGNKFDGSTGTLRAESRVNADRETPATVTVVRDGGSPTSFPIVLHRVVRAQGKKPLVTWGDNSVMPDLLMPGEHVLGKAVSVVSDSGLKPIGCPRFRTVGSGLLLRLIEAALPARNYLKQTRVGRACRTALRYIRIVRQ